MTGITYELATPGVVGEKFQEGMVILNLDTGTYFDVGERLAALLTAFDAGINIDALQHGVDSIEAGSGQHLVLAVAKMRDFGLLREIPATLAAAPADVCAKIINAGPTFFIEGHDDLAALIAADPVHDVHPVTGKLI